MDEFINLDESKRSAGENGQLDEQGLAGGQSVSVTLQSII
jgi:hypothetical protein